MNCWNLAQLNIGRIKGPLEDPVMAGFVERLDSVNAAADVSPGFVWRLQTEDGNATSVRFFDDDMLLVNLSVWESIESLRTYVYEGIHLEPLRMRRDWFDAPNGPYLVLWWIVHDTIPSVEEAVARLRLLEARGATADAFTFRRNFPAPASE